MGIDQGEARRRRKADAPKYSSKQPIAAIEKRVIDSKAFANLPPSAVVVLLLLARNLNKGRNGHVFLSKEDAEHHGIERNTLYKAFKVLTTAGFIFPTAAGGHGKCATYALTWLPMSKDTDGLLVDDYRTCAWRDRESDLIGWKKRGGKRCTSSGHFPAQTTQTVDGFPPRVVDVFTPLEVNTSMHRSDWITGELQRMASAGLAGRQCFAIPSGRTLQ